jgi:predicted secreted Zn-dependent protease
MATSYLGPRHHTYTVSGSLEEVAATIETRKEAGSTEWFPDLKWNSDAAGNVTSAEVTCEIHITMPEWDGYKAAAPADRASWDAFFAALTEHEDGHVWIVHQWLDGCETSLRDNTEATVDAAWENLKAMIQHNSDEFDALTKHGTERGCIINLPEPEPAEAEAEQGA